MDLGNDDQLQMVFNLCEPNSQGLISTKKLQTLFRQYTNQEDDQQVRKIFFYLFICLN